MRSINIKSKFENYSVNFTELQDTISAIKDFTIVVDSNVLRLYSSYFEGLDVISFDCVEANKTLDGSKLILDQFIKRKLKSNAKVAVIGGGILQDVAGFACSVYCRGIKYVLIPTTLLAQCDSCIGGKTSINFSETKNILGTFYPPETIYLCVDFLNTLNQSDFLSGLGEIIKFNLLQSKLDAFIQKDVKNEIGEIIFDSLTYKTHIIEVDEFDRKERKFLNFGHTFGHALESTSNYTIPHGTAVLFGILIANKVAVKLGYLKKDYYFETIYQYVKHQPVDLKWFDFDSLLEVIRLDKKNTGSINMILLTETTPTLAKIENIGVLKEAVSEVYESIRLHH